MDQLRDTSFVKKNKNMTLEQFITQHCDNRCAEITEEMERLVKRFQKEAAEKTKRMASGATGR